jgi:hypothetical protein
MEISVARIIPVRIDGPVRSITSVLEALTHDAGKNRSILLPSFSDTPDAIVPCSPTCNHYLLCEDFA